jgi:hypothetical protein
VGRGGGGAATAFLACGQPKLSGLYTVHLPCVLSSWSQLKLFPPLDPPGGSPRELTFNSTALPGLCFGHWFSAAEAVRA